MSYTVRVQSASGVARDIRVTAKSEDSAIREALKQCDPDAGFLPISVLPW